MILESAIYSANTGEKGTVFTKINGTTRFALPLGEGPSGTNDTEILRGDFAKLLYKATEKNTEWRFGDHISSLKEIDGMGRFDEKEGNGGVRVVFQSGKAETYDFVVLADGVGSRTRKMVFSPEDVQFKPLGLCECCFSPLSTPRLLIYPLTPQPDADLPFQTSPTILFPLTSLRPARISGS